ncbi:MAG: hypothetical protein NC350_01090 [Corallococcus sp.]|nr:hypothetical protein [Corallococcus sp.]
MVQEYALYLCEHYGEHLNDILGYNGKGKSMTISLISIKKMMKPINRKTSDYYRSTSLEDLMPVNEPSIEKKEEVEQDYTVYDNIVKSLNYRQYETCA